MFHASEVTERMNWPIISIRNFWAALNRPACLPGANEATGRVQVKASFDAAEEAGAAQGLDRAIDAICALYGQDFGARRLAREVSRNRCR